MTLILTLVNCTSEEKSFQGYVEGDNIYIASPYAGLLNILAVKRGQRVTRGQLLFQLDKNPELLVIQEYDASVRQAQHVLKDLEQPKRQPEIQAIKAQIDQTKADKGLAAIRLTRQQKLFTRGVAAKDTVDAAVAHYQQLEQLEKQYRENLKLAETGSRNEQILAQKAQIDSLKSRLGQAYWQLAQKHREAPFSGIIFDTYFREGEWVGSQQPVVSLLTAENVHIEFFVPAPLLSTLKTGQSLEFAVTGSKTRSKGKVYYISPEAEFMPPLVYSRENANKLVFRVQLALTEFGQYKPGQPVTVYLP